MITSGIATQGCRDRQRQVLGFVEERGRVAREELIAFVEGTSCPVGHDVHWASLSNALLDGQDGDLVGLAACGGEWLVEHGRPSPDWTVPRRDADSPLRDWQARALQAWCDHGRVGVVQAVTGTGKSRVGVEAVHEALAHDYSVVVVVPTIDLVEQWVKTLRRAKIAGVGASADGQRASFASHDVVVGTVQSLYLAPPSRPDGKVLLVADECHRYGAEVWGQVLSPSYRRRLGLTATFERSDDGIDRLLEYFGGTPVFEIAFREAIADGVVAHYDVQLLGVDLTPAERSEYEDASEMLSDARMRLLAADFTAEPFGTFMSEVQKAADHDEDPTIEEAARRYLKAFATRIEVMTDASAKLDAVHHLASVVEASAGALLFTRRVDTAEAIAEVLQEEGVRAAPIHSGLSRGERRERLIELRVHRLKALVAPTVLDEGIDVPDIDLAVVMGGSRSRRQMIQRMGRVLRLKPDGGKATFIVVYARDTAEDLMRTSGEEGCLDLIVDAADSVTTFVSAEDLARGEASRQVAEDVSDGRVVVAADASATLVASAPLAVGSSNNVRVRELDPASLPMTRRALDAFRHLHGGTDARAAAELRVMLEDFQQTSVVRESSTPGVVVARRDGFGLALAVDGFVSYHARSGDTRTWSEVQADASGDEEGEEPSPVKDVPSVGYAEIVCTSDDGEVAAISEEREAIGAEGPTEQASRSSTIRDLERLVELHLAGLLTESEFARAKAHVLA